MNLGHQAIIEHFTSVTQSVGSHIVTHSLICRTEHFWIAQPRPIRDSLVGMTVAIAIIIGLVSGISGGLFGIGGGIIIIPACIYALSMGQKQAQGASLTALLLPVGALAVWKYWSSGVLDKATIYIGLWIAAGFVLGGLVGSTFAVNMNELLLRRCFAGFLVLVAAQLFFKG